MWDGIIEDRLIYDERKKRYVNTGDMPGWMMRNYTHNVFKSQRPDIVGEEALNWDRKLRLGQSLLRQMTYQSKLELKRLWRSMGNLSYLYFYVSFYTKFFILIYLQPVADDFFKTHNMDKPRMLKMWTWDDSSRIVNFMDEHIQRSTKYGLDLPVFNDTKME